MLCQVVLNVLIHWHSSTNICMVAHELLCVPQPWVFMAAQSVKPRMSPAEPGDTQPSTQTHQLLCPPSQKVLGSAPTENHDTGVDTPGNIFRKEDRATYTFLLPLLPPGRLSQSCLHPTSSSPLHPLTSLVLAGEGDPSLGAPKAGGLLESPVQNSSR